MTKPTPEQRAHRFPSFLPDGRHFIYSSRSHSATVSGEVVPGPRLERIETPAGRGLECVLFAPGELLFVREGTLLRQSFDARHSR